mgnify:FL=1|tara:strand:- start:167 stop:775 length:609 start_codon:yes stop_codon:yes gene_type:complete
MKQLTNEQWELYEKKYGRLMHTISYKISGDLAIATPEDNYSDLCIAALESIAGYHKKTGKTFDEAIDTKLFDQYTKTVLWNRKAKKGIPLTKRMGFRKKQVSLDATVANSDSSFVSLIPDTAYQMDVSSIDFKVFIEEQPDDVRTVIEAVMKDPSLISKHGFIKKSELSSALNVSSYFVSKSLKKLQKIMRTYSKEEGCADD